MPNDPKPAYDESLYSGNQYADSQIYLDRKNFYRVRRDEYGNELVEGGGFHATNNTPEEQAGFERFSACDEPIFHSVMKGCTIYTPEDAGPRGESYTANPGRADRGPES